MVLKKEIDDEILYTNSSDNETVENDSRKSDIDSAETIKTGLSLNLTRKAENIQNENLQIMPVDPIKLRYILIYEINSLLENYLHKLLKKKHLNMSYLT